MKICGKYCASTLAWVQFSNTMKIKVTNADQKSVLSDCGLNMSCNIGQSANPLESRCMPWSQGSWGQHGAHLGWTGPRWAPCWPHEPCYLWWLKHFISNPNTRYTQTYLAHGSHISTSFSILNAKYILYFTGTNMKTTFPRYGDSHVKDKMVTRPSYL